MQDEIYLLCLSGYNFIPALPSYVPPWCQNVILIEFSSARSLRQLTVKSFTIHAQTSSLTVSQQMIVDQVTLQARIEEYAQCYQTGPFLPRGAKMGTSEQVTARGHSTPFHALAATIVSRS